MQFRAPSVTIWIIVQLKPSGYLVSELKGSRAIKSVEKAVENQTTRCLLQHVNEEDSTTGFQRKLNKICNFKVRVRKPICKPSVLSLKKLKICLCELQILIVVWRNKVQIWLLKVSKYWFGCDRNCSNVFFVPLYNQVSGSQTKLVLLLIMTSVGSKTDTLLQWWTEKRILRWETIF